jgi:hypothetical protein
MTENIKELQARLRFVAEQGDLQKVKQATDQVEAGMKKIGGATDEATKRLMKMRENAEKLQQMGTTLGVAGAAILAPFLLAARTYTQQVGQSEETSRRWIKANEKLQDAQVRVGRETMKVLTPLLEKGADLADKFATFIEKNPDVLKAILTVGGGLAAAGTVVTLIAQAQKLIATVQLLTGAGAIGIAAGGAAGAAGKAGILAGLTPLLPAIIAAVAAYLALNAIKIPGQKESAWASGTRAGGELLTIAAAGWGTMFGGPELAAKWGKSIGELTGVIQKADDATQQATDAFAGFTNEQLKAYLAYIKADQEAEQAYKQKRSDLISNARQAELEAERAYQKQRSDLISNANQTAHREDEDFNRKRSQTLRDFYQSEQQTEADYYANRMRIARDSSLAAARAEEDHQRELRNLQEDHADRMNDLAASRDALGMVREMRSAEKERRNVEENYQIEVRRKNEDLANTLADNEAQFSTQRQQRFDQFQQQLADEDEQRKIDAQRRKEDFDQQLLELDNQYKIEAQKRSDDFNKQLRDLADQFYRDRNQRRQAFQLQLQDTADALSQERTLKAQYNAAMLADLRNIYNQALADMGGSSPPGKDIGGYTSNGIYRMHKHEFVMTDKTTSVVEALAGGALDQDKLLSLLAGAAGGRGQVQYNDNRRIDSRLSSEDRRLINQDTYQILGDLVNGII